MQHLGPAIAWKIPCAFTSHFSVTVVTTFLLFPANSIPAFFSYTSFPFSFSAQIRAPHLFPYILTMSQSTTSDLVSTIATQLNIVIVALRLLVDMIQNPDAASPVDMTPGSCPSRPPASPASPLFQTTTRPSISWAPCEQPVPRSELSLTLPRTPPPSPTSSAGTRTPPALPSSPAFFPSPPPFSPPSSPVPSPSPLPANVALSSPSPLSFPPSPVTSHPRLPSIAFSPLSC